MPAPLKEYKMKSFCEKIRKKYCTSDPFELARCLGIVVLFEELGTINGYFNTVCRQRFIHINQNLTDREVRLTLAHEIGHVLLHPTTNTYFLRSKTRFSVGSFEYEANLFAVCFLISDEELFEYREFSLSQLSAVFGLPEELIEMRIKS